ncbi:DUF3365 domain-containing protein [Lutibacter holmesii]|uniref:DUF3365 domain-containing protein n=1 Tax=Lutibacter holmesii TaxID=1137985 RepID=A0ABW3WN07_9FLAO
MFKKVLILAVLISFVSCSSEFSEKEKQEYTVKGKEIAQATFKELSTNLMTQMKAGGPAQAIPFCNQEASPITEALSKKYNVEIKRTSNKLRSCDNDPSEREIEIMDSYEQLMLENKELKPIVEIDENQKKHFYAPIKIKANCLVCHGKVNETMTVETDSIIKSIYQFDIATGYTEGDLRGLWSITFNK